MRPIERIDNFLEKVDWGNLINTRWKLYKPIQDNLFDILYSTSMVRTYWKENPDQRIGQVLINLGLINEPYEDKNDSHSCNIWLDEEYTILEAQGLPPEECLFWTSNYDKHMNLLEKPIVRLVKDMSKNHIISIKSYFASRDLTLPSNYITAFNNVLKSDNPNEY